MFIPSFEVVGDGVLSGAVIALIDDKIVARTPDGKTSSAAALMVRAREGDTAAWGHLFDRYNGQLVALARSLGLDRDEAHDAAQTAWLRLVEHAGSLRDPGLVGPWLVTTLRRRVYSDLRLRRREVLSSMAGIETEDPDPSPEEQAVVRDSRARVRRAMNCLPARHWKLLHLLSDSDTPNYRRVSAQLGMPIGSIGPSRARSLDQLRRHLRATGAVPG